VGAWLLAACACSCSTSSALPPEDLAVEHEPDLLGYPDHTVWAVSAGGGGYDHANAIAIDAKDSAIITGEVVGGPWYAASIGPGGGFSWKTASVTTGSYSGADVAVGPNGDLFVSGTFVGTLKIGGFSVTSRGGRDVFVVRLSSSGKPLWLWSGGGDEDEQSGCIAVDSQGNSYFVGEFNFAHSGRGTARFGDRTLTAVNLADIFVVKLGPTGGVLWALSAGGQSYEWGISVTALADGGAAVCGMFNDKATFGQYALTSNGQSDMFVTRLAADGSFMWATRGGGTGDDDCFVARLDGQGRFVWAEGGGGAGGEYCGGFAVTPAGLHIVGGFEARAYFGTTVLDSRGEEDVFVASYALDGALRWVVPAGGPGLDWGLGIAAYSDGTLGVTGIFRDHAYFGRTKLVSQGMTDIFVWRLRPPN